MNIFKATAFAALLGVSNLALAADPMQPSGVVQAVMANSDKDFFETAASANLFEVESGKLAETKATDPALKQYAAMMVKDHTEASTKLAALAQSKNVSLPTQMLKRHQMLFDDLKDDKAGKEFDESYKNKMVISHKEAVSLFDQTAKKSKDPEVKKFAATALPKLQHHGGAASELNKKK